MLRVMRVAKFAAMVTALLDGVNGLSPILRTWAYFGTAAALGLALLYHRSSARGTPTRQAQRRTRLPRMRRNYWRTLVRQVCAWLQGPPNAILAILGATGSPPRASSRGSASCMAGFLS
jgi:hypothetical protein